MPEPQPAFLLDEELLGHRLLGVVEQLDERAAEHSGEQVEIELRADERGRPQGGTGRSELVAARRHRVDERGGQVRSGGLLRQLGEEERMASGARVERLDASGADELGRGCPVEHIKVDHRGARLAARPRRLASPRRRWRSGASDRRRKCSRSTRACPARCASSTRMASGPRALRRLSTRASAA